MTIENPEWVNFSCQECVKKFPIIKTYTTVFAEDIIDKICTHKEARI